MRAVHKTREKGRRVAAAVLCLCMALSMAGGAPAADSSAPGEEALCTHTHDETCGYVAPSPGSPCDRSCTDTDGNGVVDHAPDCGYAAPTEGAPCTHVHDETCGGLPTGEVPDTQGPAESPAPEEDGTPEETPAETPDPGDPGEPPEEGPAPGDPEGEEPPADVTDPSPSAPAEDDPAGEDDTPEEPEDEPSPAPEDPAAPEDPSADPDADPQGDPSTEDGPTADGETETDDPDAPEDEIMPLALEDVHVTVKENNTSAAGQEIPGEGAELTWEHNKKYQLNVSANFNTVTDGQVVVSVAPGLRIDSYFSGSTNFDSVEPSATHQTELKATGYTFQDDYDTVTYTVSSTAAKVSIDLTLSVDTVLWNKEAGWKLTDAIQVDVTGDGATETRKANVTVNYGSETSPSWNRLYVSDANESVPAQAGKEFHLKTLQVATNLHNSPLGLYYPSLTITVPLPKVRGAETYANYVRVDTVPARPPQVSQDTANHTVTFTWENLYVPAGNNFSITPYFQWAGSQSPGATVEYSNYSLLAATATTYPSGTVSFAKDTSAPTFTVRDSVDVTVEARNRQIYNYGSTAQVYQLGQFKLRNIGFEATGPLTLVFDYSASTGAAHVTAQTIPLGSGSRVTGITYETNRSSGALTIDSKYYRGGSFPDYLAMAPAGEYFTKLTATIEGFPALYMGYNNSADASPSNACVTFGTIAASGTTGAFTASLTITGTDVDESSSLSSTIVKTNRQTTQMDVIPAGALFTFQGKSTTLAKLGTDEVDRTISFSGYISTTSYPYTNNQVVDRPVIYIRLPDTIRVPEGSIKLSAVKTDHADNILETKDIGSGAYTVVDTANRGGEGFHVCSITFNDDNSYSGAIGWFNEKLGETRLKLEFNMVADVNVADMTLVMHDTVFVGYADGSPIDYSGSLASSQRQDTDDVDGDGDTTEHFSTMRDLDAYQLEIDAPRIGLNFNSYAKLHSEDTGSYKNFKVPSDNVEGLHTDGHIMYLTQETLNDPNAGIDFLFTAKNETGSALTIDSDTLGQEDFYYYIPVPKKGDKWDDHIQDKAFGLSMILGGQVEVSGDAEGLVEVLYSTTVDASSSASDSLHYNNAATVPTNYKTWAEVESDKENIRMIRISVRQRLTPEQKAAGFPEKYSASFTIHYKFVEADKSELVGQYIEFGPCGITTYKRNNEDASGHTPTQRIRAEIQTGSIAGRVFLDTNYNGVCDEGETLGLNARGIRISAQHKVGADPGLDPDTVTHSATAPDGDGNTYELTGLQARTYTVTVVNREYMEGQPTAGSLRFISLTRSDGNRVDSAYAAGYLPQTAFDVVVNGANQTQNRQMDIGLQLPHTVTFRVEYVDAYAGTASSTPASPVTQTVYVWHGESLNSSHVEVPSFTLDGDFQWEHGDHPEWTLDGETVDPATSTVNGNVTYTARAARKSHTVTYDMNLPVGYETAKGVPAPETAVNGQSVALKCVNGDPTEKPAVTGVAAAAFIGWTADRDTRLYDKSTPQSGLPPLLTTVTMGAAEQTVYALWGLDTNGNGAADVAEDRYTVTYNAGFGGNAPAAETNRLVNETFALNDGASMTHPAGTGAAILFMGWTQGTTPEKIYSKDDISQRESIQASLRAPNSPYTVTGDATLYAVWAYDENNNGTADFQETMFKLDYYDNGVPEHPAGYPAETEYLPGTEVPLWQPKDPWKAVRNSRRVVFVGWSAEQKSDPVSEAPADLLEQVTMPSERDQFVYAVWAYDRDDNGIPDYEEIWYNLNYDRNGGTGEPTDGPASVRILPGGSRVVLPSAGIQWTRTIDGTKGVFAGWSRTRTDVIFDQKGEATVDGAQVRLRENDFLVTSPYRIGAEVTGDITLYAVYAEDDNGDGEPDYMESAWQVYYYANGGTAADPDVTIQEDGLFRMCGHHHVAGEKGVALMDLDTGKHLIERENAVLLGWSLKQTGTPVKTAEEAEAAEITTTVDMPEDRDDNRYVQVYAVWAEDLNGNHVADYLDDHWHQWYFYNNALTYWRPDGLSDDETAAAQGMNDMPEGVDYIRYGKDELPAARENILTGMTVDVPGITLLERWDYDSEGNELHHYVQLGWSGYCHPAATSGDEAVSWIHLDEDLETPGVQRIVGKREFQYNFAVWALDDNHNGKPDYEDSRYALTFDLKGGTGGPENRTNVLEGSAVTLSPAPTKDRALFLGWSTEDPGADLTAAPGMTLLPAEGPWTMPSADTTLYAVWAADRDGDGTADYEQYITIRYDGNPQREGGTANVPEAQTELYAAQNALLSGLVPTHTPVNGQNVRFVTWSLTPTERIYGRSERGLLRSDAPLEQRYDPGESFPLPGNTEEVTLYAVWGYDENDKNGPDVVERRYTLTYNANGGSFAPDPVRGMLEGQRLERLSMDAKYGRENVILVGWTTPENRQAEILTWDHDHSRSGQIDSRIMVAYTMGAADATVYAVWAEDLNGNGIPDYRESKNTLTYHYTGAETPKDLTQSAEYLPGTAVSLWRDENAGTEKAWSRGEGDGRSVFVGWTLNREKAAKVLTGDPKPEDRVWEVVMTGDVDVYALWAEDRNGNGIPDHQEEKVTLTLDPNGGMDGKNDAQPLYLRDLLPGANTSLNRKEAEGWTKTLDGLVLVFTGWSEEPLSGYMDEKGFYRDAARADGVPAEELLLIGPYTVPAEDTTLYAAYAVDEDGDGAPDYIENSVHVEYYANGGTSADGKWLNDTEELFYICPHRHNPGDTERELLTPEQGAAYISRQDAVLMGWATSPVGLCLTEAQVAAALVETATLPAGGGNAKLYAVWAADNDDNGIPDDEETEKGPVGALTVAKTVQGPDGEKDRLWHFRVELSDEGLSGLYGDMLFEDGAAEFTLRHGQTATAEELPAGLIYTVTEQEAGKDGYTTDTTGETGVIPEEDTAKASFVNSRETVSDSGAKTGDSAHIGVWLGFALLSAMGFLSTGAALLRKRPREAAGRRGRR